MQEEAATQLDAHIRASRQIWLTGAGISVEAGIPLMYPLTERVFSVLGGDSSKAEIKQLIDEVKEDLPDDLHIEHILSHFGDLIALAERSKDKHASVGKSRVSKNKLQKAHHEVLRCIRDILKWGYAPSTKEMEERIGTREKPIVSIERHREFVRALYRVNRAGLDDRRHPIHFVTTNYDTLIEDALALELIPYEDGFDGGAIGSWNPSRFVDDESVSICKAVLTKLHGSIDWLRSGSEAGKVFRVRYDDLYPIRNEDSGSVVIYPQSTKYVASREDPFGFLFQRLKKLLSPSERHVVFVCGYSFGDDHIDAIVEQQVLHPESKTTLVVFAKSLPKKVNNWRKTSAGPRIFVLTEDGLYRGGEGPFFSLEGGEKRSWWTFSGATNLITNGLPDDISEAIQ